MGEWIAFLVGLKSRNLCAISTVQLDDRLPHRNAYQVS